MIFYYSSPTGLRHREDLLRGYQHHHEIKQAVLERERETQSLQGMRRALGAAGICNQEGVIMVWSDEIQRELQSRGYLGRMKGEWFGSSNEE